MPARSKRYNEDRSGIVRCSWHGARLKGAYLHSVIVLVDATSVSTNRLSLSRSPFTDSFRKRSGKRETRRGRVELEIPIATEFVNSSFSLPSLLPSPTLPPLPLKIIHDRLPAVQRLPLALLFFPSPSFLLLSFPPFVSFSPSFHGSSPSSMRPYYIFPTPFARASSSLFLSASKF